jgi:hypothetical protein
MRGHALNTIWTSSLERDQVVQSENMTYKSCRNSIVFIRESIENKGVPPGEEVDGS